MKKFFALMFVCAGLTAMAAVPHVNSNKVNVVNGKPAKAMVMKSNTLGNQLMAPVMAQADAKVVTPQGMIKERGLKASDNKLMKKAPRRVAAEDVASTKLAFLLAYEYNEDSGKVVMCRNYFAGGWDVEMEQLGDNQYGAYLYFTGIPFTINVDLANNSAEMVMENLAGWQWSDTVKSGNTTTINDTTEYVYIVNENFMLDDNATEFTNLTGEIDEDGSIYFPDGWCIYQVDYVTKRVTRSGRTTTTYDTVGGMSNFYRGTYLITPNATHTYDYPKGNQTGLSNNAYMFQYDDTTAMVWNLWGMAARGVEMYIHEDGTMMFPAYQIVGTGDIANLKAQYPAYDWETAGYYFLNCDPNDENETGDSYGTVTNKTITWDGTEWHRICYQNGTSYVMSYYPMTNNVLQFTGDDEFLLGTTQAPVISYEVFDENVVVTAAPADELETEVVLFIYNAETQEATPVDNPYTVERTDADQTITFAALAQANGKMISDPTLLEVTIPALEVTSLRGDVDLDGVVGIADVTALIDYILSKDATGISLVNADTDLDGTVGIADATALIDYILNKGW